jgi:CheY-like chemotaxis protein
MDQSVSLDTANRIEVIEDDVDQREIRTLLLRMKGYRLVEAPEAADLVLMDLRIPTVEAGIEKIRSLSVLKPRPKIIVLSGGVAPLEQAPERELVDAILEKPCPSGKLLRVIERLLNGTTAPVAVPD